jgi:Multidrug resistance efflux pump
VWVVANFKETQLKKMKVGQSVSVRVDAIPGRDFKAHVESFQVGTGSRFTLLPPENATGNFVKVVQRVPVKIVFDEPWPILSGSGPVNRSNRWSTCMRTPYNRGTGPRPCRLRSSVQQTGLLGLFSSSAHPFCRSRKKAIRKTSI